MLVTLNMLLAALRDWPTECFVPEPDACRLGGVELRCGDASSAAPERMAVCALEELLCLPEPPEGRVFVCVCPPEGEAPPPERLRGAVLVRAEVSLYEVFRRLNERFLSILDWRMRMVEAMNDGCSLQEIMEMSKPMIGNYIAVSDSTFRLVANTANVPCDDEICRRMIEHGYHPESVVAKFRDTGRVRFWEEHDFYIDNGHVFSPYTLVGRIFRIDGSYAAHAVMTCNNCPASADIVDLYNVLCEFIAKFAARDWENQNAALLLYSSLLTEVLGGGVRDFAEAEQQLLRSGFPAEHACYLFRIPVSTVADTLVGRLCKDLHETFSHVHLTMYRQELVLLIGVEKGRQTETDAHEGMCRMLALLDRYELVCGVSAAFGDMSAFFAAYRQAGQALGCGERLRRSARIDRPRKGPERAFTYDEYLPYCLLSEQSFEEIEQWRAGEAAQTLRRIEALDRRRGSNDLQLLYTYLINERRAKETGEALHLHRNSVVYRIEHLRETAQLGDLEDAQLRAALLMSFLMLDLYGSEE